MSRVYFHSPSGEAELRGSERAYLSGLVSNIADGLLNPDGWGREERLRALTNPNHYMAKIEHRPGGWQADFRRAFGGGMFGDELLVWRGKPISSFSMQLNTAALVGNDQIKLAARIHGQCEIHAYVEGPNRAWLADIMQVGIDSGIYRKGFHFKDGPDGPQKWSDQGWESVIALLRARDDEPVVMSYSVCDQFPNRHTAGWEPPPMPDGWAPGWADTDEGHAEWERDYPTPEDKAAHYADTASDRWYDLDDAEKWRISLAGLRASTDGLELKPDNWQTFRFRHELTVFDLFAADSDERLERALGD